eukprot:725065-Rhodomonas_salina.2
MLQCFLRSTVTRTRQSEREVRACPCLLSCLISFSLRLRDVQLVHDVCRQVEGNGHRIPVAGSRQDPHSPESAASRRHGKKAHSD